jgi:N-acetylmuramoyl-L-alanine amidase
MNIRIMQSASDNFSQEGEISPKYIIIHCIGYEEAQALKILTKSVEEGGGGASAHYFIPDIQLSFPSSAYPVHQLVPENKKAWHAGISAWRQDRNLNSCSIGIEFNSPNYANAVKKQPNEALNWFHFEEFGTDQIKAGIVLLQQLIQKHNISPENILAHSDIAPWKEANSAIQLGKTDPGATFPWEKLARAGIGIWPKQQRTRSSQLDVSVTNVQHLFSEYGYALDVTGALDEKTQHVIGAFQLRFAPDQCDGKISEKLVILLENLIDKQYQFNPLSYSAEVKNDDYKASSSLSVV